MPRANGYFVPGFKTQRGMQFAFAEPKEREITDRQREWLTNYMNAVEAVVFGEPAKAGESAYQGYLDVDSFIDYHWIVELSRSVDGYGFSIFLHKDRAGKLSMGPIWDWDLSFGNDVSYGAGPIGGWQWERFDYPLYGWYKRLFEHPDFLQRYIDRWSELRTNVFETANIWAAVDESAGTLSEALVRNYQRWPTLTPLFSSNQLIGGQYRQ